MDKYIIMKNIAKNLKLLRHNRGVSQQYLIQSIGIGKISVRTLINYEKGNNLASLEELVQLAQYFNVTIDYLISNHDERAEFTWNKILNELNDLIYLKILVPINNHPLGKDNCLFISGDNEIKVHLCNVIAFYADLEFKYKNDQDCFFSIDDLYALNEKLDFIEQKVSLDKNRQNFLGKTLFKNHIIQKRHDL